MMELFYIAIFPCIIALLLFADDGYGPGSDQWTDFEY